MSPLLKPLGFRPGGSSCSFSLNQSRAGHEGAKSANGTKSDVPLALTNVCFEGKNGHDAGVTPFPIMTHSRHRWGAAAEDVHFGGRTITHGGTCSVSEKTLAVIAPSLRLASE